MPKLRDRRQALPVGSVDTVDEANALLVLVGERSYVEPVYYITARRLDFGVAARRTTPTTA